MLQLRIRKGCANMDGDFRDNQGRLTLDDMAGAAVWVAWRNEERGGKITKIPYDPANGRKARCDDPASWASRRMAERRAKRIVDGAGGGVGVILGTGCGDETLIGGIDLDACRSPTGDFEPWAQEVIARFRSYAEVSPSGTGAKIFFRYRSADVPRLRQLMGTQHGRMFKRATGGDHPPAIELHVSNRYFAVTDDALGDAELRLVEITDLEWLLTVAGPAFVGGEAGAGAGAGGNGSSGFQHGPRDQSRSGAAFRLGLAMHRAGADFEAFREAVSADPETAGWYREKGAANDERELRRIWEKVETQMAEGVGLGDFYAHMLTHSYIFAASGETWPGASVDARIAPVPLLDAEGNPVAGKDGKPRRVAASQWLDRNRPVEQVTWVPGEPQIVEDRLTSHAGWIERKGVRVFNFYRPPAIALGDAGAARPWRRLVRRVFPAEHRHITAYLAHRVQRPGQKINHALVLGGGQGIGKDSALEPVKQAIGPWNWHDISPADLIGKFNGFTKSVVLRINEGRDLGEIDRYGFYEHAKTYTAAPPDVLRTNEKYMREYYVPNVCGVIITTNHKTGGIYLPPDDRRHFVAWSNSKKEDFDQDYWEQLWRWYRDGGFGHVAAYLNELDISGFDPKAPPPKTDAWWAIVDAGIPPENVDVRDALDALKNPDAFVLDDLADAARGAFGDWLRDRKNLRAIPHRIEACGYTPVRNPDADGGRWRIGGKRVVAYARSDLTPSEQIEAVRHRQKERPL
jgi:hypothetical protein